MTAQAAVQPGESAHWYCVHTKPRAEALALEHLQRQAFECLLPRIQHSVLRGGRRQRVVEPLFPRYLFLRANPEQQSLAAVRSTRGALGLVRPGGAATFNVPIRTLALVQEGEGWQASYGVGSSFETVKALAPHSTVLEGYSTRGGVERDGVLFVMDGNKEKQVQREVTAWLKKINLLPKP